MKSSEIKATTETFIADVAAQCWMPPGRSTLLVSTLELSDQLNSCAVAKLEQFGAKQTGHLAFCLLGIASQDIVVKIPFSPIVFGKNFKDVSCNYPRRQHRRGNSTARLSITPWSSSPCNGQGVRRNNSKMNMKISFISTTTSSHVHM